MGSRIITGVFGDVTKYFGLEHDGKKVKHVRGHVQDCRPALARVKHMAQAAPSRHEKTREYKYIGSIPRTMIDDWLKKRQKTWHDYATDLHLKQAFELFMMAERPAFFMKAYR